MAKRADKLKKMGMPKPMADNDVEMDMAIEELEMDLPEEEMSEDEMLAEDDMSSAGLDILEDVSDEDLLAEMQKRGLAAEEESDMDELEEDDEELEV